MKKFFSTVANPSINGVRGSQFNKNLLASLKQNKQRALEELKKIELLPLDKQPKSVDSNELEKLMEHASELRKDSHY